MPVLGRLGDGHLRSAMAAIAAHVLARGDDLAYGGDLRGGGFTELLLELVVRYSPRDVLADRARVTDYLAWARAHQHEHRCLGSAGVAPR